MNIRIEEIPIEEFDLSLCGMRIINPDWVLRVQNSIWLHGQLQPVVAREHEGKYQIIDGFKRYYISVDLEIKTLQCQVLDIDLQQAKLLILSYNRPHQSMEVWEEAMVLEDLLKTHDLSQQSLSRLTGYSRSWVSRRLSLISKIDEEVASEIRMGTLTSSQARVLIKLPRGNQLEVARVITTFGLSSRLSDRLVNAFLEAEDEDQQRHILAHPEHILWDQTDLPENPYDDRLSSYGNDLMHSIMNLYRPLRTMLSKLGDRRIGELNKSEKVIIAPFLLEVSGYAGKLSEANGQLQLHKQGEQDER
ncbi:MAG: ParB/RepB/Spo0J family partition protein [Bacteroidales bacterium]|nr:ParB/RepB/Spo0J family partition protein [Bacteroidales bacterium]